MLLKYRQRNIFACKQFVLCVSLEIHNFSYSFYSGKLKYYCIFGFQNKAYRQKFCNKGVIMDLHCTHWYLSFDIHISGKLLKKKIKGKVKFTVELPSFYTLQNI